MLSGRGGGLVALQRLLTICAICWPRPSTTLKKIARRGGCASTIRSARSSALWPPSCTARWIRSSSPAASPTARKTIDAISEMVSWIAPITVYPGEDELLALAPRRAARAQGRGEAQEYRRPVPGTTTKARLHTGRPALRRAIWHKRRPFGCRTELSKKDVQRQKNPRNRGFSF